MPKMVELSASVVLCISRGHFPLYTFPKAMKASREGPYVSYRSHNCVFRPILARPGHFLAAFDGDEKLIRSWLNTVPYISYLGKMPRKAVKLKPNNCSARWYRKIGLGIPACLPCEHPDELLEINHPTVICIEHPEDPIHQRRRIIELEELAINLLEPAFRTYHQASECISRGAQSLDYCKAFYLVWPAMLTFLCYYSWSCYSH